MLESHGGKTPPAENPGDYYFEAAQNLINSQGIDDRSLSRLMKGGRAFLEAPPVGHEAPAPPVEVVAALAKRYAEGAEFEKVTVLLALTHLNAIHRRDTAGAALDLYMSGLTDLDANVQAQATYSIFLALHPDFCTQVAKNTIDRRRGKLLSLLKFRAATEDPSTTECFASTAYKYISGERLDPAPLHREGMA